MLRRVTATPQDAGRGRRGVKQKSCSRTVFLVVRCPPQAPSRSITHLKLGVRCLEGVAIQHKELLASWALVWEKDYEDSAPQMSFEGFLKSFLLLSYHLTTDIHNRQIKNLLLDAKSRILRKESGNDLKAFRNVEHRHKIWWTLDNTCKKEKD